MYRTAPAARGLVWRCGEAQTGDTEDLKTPPGPKLVEIIDARIGDLAAKYQGIYPAAARVLLTDRVGLTACLRFPAGHHHRIRHSDFVERTFGETRRRVRVIGRLPGETSCLTLVWAVLDRASRGWRGLDHDRRRPAAAPGPAPFAPQATPPPAATHGHHRRALQTIPNCQHRRLT